MRPDPLAPLLAAGGVVVIDGGLGTQLEAQGAYLSDPLWSARLLRDAPDEIVAAHLAYYRAGARLAITSSYQATFAGYADRGIARDDAADLMRRSVRLASAARERHLAERGAGETGPLSIGVSVGPLFVGASVGPYGAMLADGSEFRGRYGLTVEGLRGFHRERMEVLADAGPDLLVCETIPEIEEATALVDLLEELVVPAWLVFSCADGAHIASGAPVEEAFALAEGSDAVVGFGVNCTLPIHLPELIARGVSVSSKTIVAYPNSGEHWDATARRWVPGPAGTGVDPAAARRWVDAGARIVGGCCRVTPSIIAELSAAELAGGRT